MQQLYWRNFSAYSPQLTTMMENFCKIDSKCAFKNLVTYCYALIRSALHIIPKRLVEICKTYLEADNSEWETNMHDKINIYCQWARSVDEGWSIVDAILRINGSFEWAKCDAFELYFRLIPAYFYLLHNFGDSFELQTRLLAVYRASEVRAFDKALFLVSYLMYYVEVWVMIAIFVLFHNFLMWYILNPVERFQSTNRFGRA